MPVTLAHPALTLPLMRWLRRETLPSALVVGSMVPDLVMWVDLGVDRDVSHHWIGLFTYCLPLGLVALVLFHALLEVPLYQLLPDAWARPLLARTTRVRDIDPLTAGWSIVLGAATHQAIDAFTHSSGLGMQLWPALRRPPWIDIPGFPLYGYQLLQYGASVAGLAMIVLALDRWRRTASAPDDPLPWLDEPLRARIRAFMLLAVGSFGAGWGWYRASQQIDAARATRFVLTRFAVGSIAAALVVLCLWGLVWRLWHNGPTPGRHGPAQSR